MSNLVIFLREIFQRKRMFVGELISLGVALSWTATALFAEVGSKRMGSLPFNTIRMTMSLAFLVITLWLVMGIPYPRYADGGTWTWLLLSGVVGYVIGDYCLMQGYIHIGSRFGQLFMTLSAPTAAITGRVFLGEQMRPAAIIGMIVTLSGIALSILSKSDDSQQHGIRFKLPARGVFYATMAGICQGLGLVMSKVGLTHYDAALSAAGIAQTLFALTPILIIAPAAVLFHQKVTAREVIGAVVSVAGVCLFFV